MRLAGKMLTADKRPCAAGLSSCSSRSSPLQQAWSDRKGWAKSGELVDGRDVGSWRPVTVSGDGVTQVPKAPHRGRMTLPWTMTRFPALNDSEGTLTRCLLGNHAVA